MGLCIAGMLWAANEITTQITFKATKGYLDVTRAVNLNFTLTAPAPNAAGLTQLITTNAAAQQISIGDVVTNGWCYMRNLDTNTGPYVSIGYSGDAGATLYEIIRLYAGEPALFRVTTNVWIYGKANGTNCVLEKLIISN